MDIMLAKILITCLVCELIGSTVGLPPAVVIGVLSSNNNNEPSEPFSPTSIQDILNSGNSVTSTLTQQDAENPIEKTSYESKRSISETSTDVLPTVSKDADKDVKSSDSNIVLQSNIVPQNIITVINNEETTTERGIANTEEPPKNDENTNKKDADAEEPDKSLIDSLFDDIKGSITTEDYTAATSDYESTTTDEDVVRIPANVVASMLG